MPRGRASRARARQARDAKSGTIIPNSNKDATLIRICPEGGGQRPQHLALLAAVGKQKDQHDGSDNHRKETLLFFRARNRDQKLVLHCPTFQRP